MKRGFLSLPTTAANALRSAHAGDAYGCEPRLVVSDGSGNPCRHCLRDIPAGRRMLVLAYRPFRDLHAYAETGPVFICADAAECPAPPGGHEVPAFLRDRPLVLVKPYDGEEQIRAAGRLVAMADLDSVLDEFLADGKTAFVDIRSALNNCWFCRVVRAP